MPIKPTKPSTFEDKVGENCVKSRHFGFDLVSALSVGGFFSGYIIQFNWYKTA